MTRTGVDPIDLLAAAAHWASDDLTAPDGQAWDLRCERVDGRAGPDRRGLPVDRMRPQ